MKYFTSLSIAIFLFLSLIFRNGHSGELFEFSSDNSSDSAQLIQNEIKIANAIKDKDADVLNEYIAAGFFYTENDAVYSRDEVMQSFLSPSDIIENAGNDDMQVHLYDNAAIVTGWLTIKGKNNDGAYTHKYRYTDIWLKTKEQWQIIAAHDYLVP